MVAGPQLLELGDDMISWLHAIRAWEEFLRRHSLGAVITDHAIAEANAHGHWPLWQQVQDGVHSSRLRVAVADIIRLFASLSGRFIEVDEEGLVLATSATGCLRSQTCTGIASEVCAAAISSIGATPVVAGAHQAETETVSATVLRQFQTGEREVGTSIEVACAPMPDDMLRAADVAEWIEEPLVALAAVRAQLAARNVPASVSEIELLPSFVASLQTMPRDRRADALETLVLLTLPPPSRPRGLRERPIRVDPGPNSAHLTSSRGQAFRATLSAHGSAWRLHYWRTQRVVTAAVVSDHDSVDIPNNRHNLPYRK